MSALETKLINGLGKSVWVYRRDHRFKKFPFAVCALKIAAASSHTDRCETVFVKMQCVVMIRNSPGDGKGKFIPEMGLPKPESFGLKIIQGELC
jgi:hypothetical protein